MGVRFPLPAPFYLSVIAGPHGPILRTSIAVPPESGPETELVTEPPRRELGVAEAADGEARGFILLRFAPLAPQFPISMP